MEGPMSVGMEPVRQYIPQGNVFGEPHHHMASAKKSICHPETLVRRVAMHAYESLWLDILPPSHTLLLTGYF